MVGRPLWERKVPSSSLGAPIFFMNNTTDNLPSLTFRHRADRGYTLRGDGSQHIVESSSFETPYPFEALTLSVDYHPRENESLLTEVQVQQHGVWSKFFKQQCSGKSDERIKCFLENTYSRHSCSHC